MPEEFYTKCYLLNGVDLDEDYEYTIDFDDETSQYNFFYAKKQLPITDLDFSYIRAEQPFKVDYKLSELEDIDYLMYQNEENEKWYYAFITKKEYVNPETTRLYVKLDVMQTYMFDYELKESFVDREHQDRFSNNYMTPIYNYENENLDYGKDYQIGNITELKDNTLNDEDLDLYWIIMLCSEPLADGNYSSSDPTTWENLSWGYSEYNRSTGYYVYLLPVNKKDKATKFYGVNYNGVDTELATGDNFAYLRTSEAIISARIYKYCPIDYSITKIDDGKYRLVFSGGWNYNQLAQSDKKNRYSKANNSNFGGIDLSLYGYRFMEIGNLNDETIKDKLGTLSGKSFTSYSSSYDIDKSYLLIPDPKTFTHPYYMYELTNYRVDPLIIKNEELSGTKDIILKQNIGSIQKSKAYIRGYLNDNGKEYAMINSNVEELPLFTDAYTSYMSSSKASATTGMALNIGASVAQIGLGVATGGIGLAVAGSQGIGLGTKVFNELTKQQDLKDTPDTIKKSGNNIEFDIIDDNLSIKVVEKYALRRYKLNRYFHHYGYKCNDFKIPNIRSRYYFNYIKTIGVNLTSDISGEYKQTLKNIFDKGITIWHYRDANTFKGVNNYDYQNKEMANI